MDVLVSEYESVFPEDGCKSGLYRKQYNLWSIHCQSRSKRLSVTTASLLRSEIMGYRAEPFLLKEIILMLKTKEYIESQNFQPDIVLIKLGTNDTKPQNWKYKDEFMADYQHLIDSYKALNSHPRIILLTPIRCFLPEGSSINAALIENLL